MKPFPIQFQKQTPMRQVLTALLPACIGSVYFFGWVSAAIVLVSVTACITTEWLFVRKTGGRVSEAALVTAVLYALTLPPTLPFPMVVLGAVFGIVFGKMAFGGFGANIFNPAMVARAFVYITFPVHMTNRWLPAADFSAFPGGFTAWRSVSGSFPDSVTAATVSHAFKAGAQILPSWQQLFLGNIHGTFRFMGENTVIGGGSLGETSALLLLAGGVFLLISKTSKWRLVAGFFSTYLVFQTLLYVWTHDSRIMDPVTALLSGGAMLGGFFMVTDPVSGARTKAGQWIYSGLIAVLSILIRSFSLFPGGLMFAVLLGNMFASLIDVAVKGAGRSR
ncbi:RnfABCDGE type electron transport complex subunit D [bacterium]|nr:RnfABCDGE type electron transport complex subunit D [bacterium]